MQIDLQKKKSKLVHIQFSKYATKRSNRTNMRFSSLFEKYDFDPVTMYHAKKLLLYQTSSFLVQPVFMRSSIFECEHGYDAGYFHGIAIQRGNFVAMIIITIVVVARAAIQGSETSNISRMQTNILFYNFREKMPTVLTLMLASNSTTNNYHYTRAIRKAFRSDLIMIEDFFLRFVSLKIIIIEICYFFLNFFSSVY